MRNLGCPPPSGKLFCCSRSSSQRWLRRGTRRRRSNSESGMRRGGGGGSRREGRLLCAVTVCVSKLCGASQHLLSLSVWVWLVVLVCAVCRATVSRVCLAGLGS